MADAACLIDTSVLVDLLRGSTEVRRWLDDLSPPQRFVSVITAAELLAGCRSRLEQRAVDRELARYTTVWLGEAVSRQALMLYRQANLSHGVGFNDCLIAATAMGEGLRLATFDLRHFAAFDGLVFFRPEPRTRREP